MDVKGYFKGQLRVLLRAAKGDVTSTKAKAGLRGREEGLRLVWRGSKQDEEAVKLVAGGALGCILTGTWRPGGGGISFRGEHFDVGRGRFEVAL